MRWIKIHMSRGAPISLPEHKVQAVLDAQQQIVQVFKKDGTWSGITINKAHIVSTEVDNEKQSEQAHGQMLERSTNEVLSLMSSV